MPAGSYRFAVWTILLLAANVVQAADKADSYSPLKPRVETGLKAGSERTIGVTEAWIPIAQNRDRVVYTDLRYSFDNNDNDENNFGIGFRGMVDDDHIIGGHAWVDRRTTALGSTFYQGTVGFEFMKRDWDFKANAYHPMTGKQTYTTPNVGNADPYLVGSGIYVDSNGSIVEEAQKGVDAEIGYRIPLFETHLDSIRVYGGGYSFRGNVSPTVAGGRVRASIDVNPWLNVGARFQHDGERGSQGFLEATLRFPFSAKQRFQDKGLRARMDESPERDVDIVTGAKVDNGLFKPVVNTESGTQQRVLYVDNTNGQAGDGTKENPFSTLAAAQAALHDNDIVYINHGDGTTTGQDTGFRVDKNNVSVIGSGADFVFDNNKFSAAHGNYSGTLLEAATTAPVLTKSDALTNFWDGAVTVTGDKVSVTGINVQGGQNGITFASTIVDHNVISEGYIGNVTVDGATNRGIYTLVYANGIDAGGYIGNMTIENVTVNHSSGLYGIVTNMYGGTIDNLTYRNNTVNQSLLWGQSISVNGGRMGSLNILDSDINRSNYGQSGLYVEAVNGGAIDEANIIGNNLSMNTGFGAELRAMGTGSTASSFNNITLRDNLINGNVGGPYLYADGDSTMSAKLEHNTVTGNTYGVAVFDNTTGAYDVDMGGGSFGSQGNNRVYGNTGTQMYVLYSGGPLKAENNWWGSSAGLDSSGETLLSGSTIDATPALTSDPGP